MNELHLFSGAGGGILGGQLLGHTAICAVEIEPFCRRILLQRQRDGLIPTFPVWDDIRTFNGKDWKGRADIVCGGFPCQDISSAGKKKGIEGKKSGLWKEMARVICEVRPRYVFVENSPDLVHRGLGTVLGDLAELGYDGCWGVFGAVDAGGPHFRYRIWILVRRRDLFPYPDNFGRTERRVNWKKVSEQKKSARWSKECAPVINQRTGVDHGLANRMDRVRDVGNGQVPQVAKLAWETLMARMNECLSKGPYK